MEVCLIKGRSLGWPKAVIFDLDGTLIDSAADIAAALNHVLAGRGLPALPEERVKQMIGGGVPKLIERALIAHGAEPEGIPALTEDFLEFYGAHAIDNTVFFDGADDLLRKLAASGVCIGVCTNKPQAISEQILRGLGAGSLVGAVVGGRPGLPKKPDPAPLRETLDALGVIATEAVMIGDSAADTGAAHALGMPVILVRHGYTRTPVEELGGDIVIDSLQELPDAIEALKINV